MPEPDSNSTSAEPSAEASSPIADVVHDVYCPACHYMLRGVVSDRCPECGLDVAAIKSRKILNPWVHRKRMGWIRAYWRMVWVLTFDLKPFVSDMAYPVTYRDARSFRRLTILFAFLPYLATGLFIISQGVSNAGRMESLAITTSVFLLGILCCLISMTAIPFYAIRSRRADPEMQHRAAVLSLYVASGKSAWTFVGYGLAMLGYFIQRSDPLGSAGMAGMIVVICGLGVVVAMMLMSMIDVFVLIAIALKPTPGTWIVSLKVFVLWIGGLVISLVGVPYTLFYLAIVFYSLV